IVDSPDRANGGGSTGGGNPPPPPQPTPTPRGDLKLITIFGNKFRPERITVNQGTTIQWRDGDRRDHQVMGATFRDANGTFYDWSPNPDPQSEIPPAPIPALNASL